MDPTIKTELVDKLDRLAIQDEGLIDWIIMTQASKIKLSLEFDGPSVVNATDDEIVADFAGNSDLNLHHPDGEKKYRTMIFREMPRYRVKILGVQQFLNNVMGVGDVIVCFDQITQLDEFCDQLVAKGYKDVSDKDDE